MTDKLTQKQIEEITKQRDIENRKARRVERIKSLGLIAQVPPKFKTATFETYIADSANEKICKSKCQNFADKFPFLKDEGMGGIILYGNVGTGKTHLAISIIKSVVRNHFQCCRYVNVFDLIGEIRSTWGNYDKHESEVIKKFCQYDLLVIDEIGVQFGNKAEKVSLFQIMNQRYNFKLPTILISNLDEAGIIDCIGEPLVDRVFDRNGGMLKFTGESKRRCVY